MRSPRFRLLIALALIGLAPAPQSRADDIQLPDRDVLEDALPEGSSLTGKEIWERFIDNRVHSAIQHQRVVSRDPGGGTQEAKFLVRWKDFRDENSEAVDGVVLKAVMRFGTPADMRGTSFMVIVNDGRDPDQFVYSPATRKVRRLNLRGVGVVGTDWTLDGVNFRGIEDADYHRLLDDEVDGVPVYVVKSTLKPHLKSNYVTAMTYIEKEHYVPLRIVYQDGNGVKLREVQADHASIEEFDGAWIPTESKIENLKEKTTTMVFTEKLEANAELSDEMFSLFRLTVGR